MLYETILQLRPKSTCEFGCGGGDHLKNLRTVAPDIDVHGMDRSRGQLGILRRRHPNLDADVRLHNISDYSGRRRLTPYQRQYLLKSYEQESVKRFVFGPVEVATFAGANDVEFDYELVDEVTAVPQAINIMISCRGLDTTMRMTGEPVQRDRLRLAVTTLYNSSALQSYLPSLGFEIVWHQNSDTVGLFLLRRSL